MMIMRAHTTTVLLLGRIATLAMLSITALACGGPAAASTPADHDVPGRAAVRRARYSPEQYPLDDATVRKVAAVIRAWTPPAPDVPKKTDPGDVVGAMQDAMEQTFTARIARDLQAGSTATIDATPALEAEIVRQGLSSRTFAEALLAVQAARWGLDFEAALPEATRDADAPGETAKANRALVRKVRAEGLLPKDWW
jgi:hypothetical protein